MKALDPILSCAAAADFEKSRLPDASAELDAMSRAGEGIARMLLREFAPMLGKAPEILVLAGKGHNGGDALCAARAVLREIPGAVLKVFLASPIESLKPNTRHFAGLVMLGGGRVRIVGKDAISEASDLMIEGLLGMSFRPPLRGDMAELVSLANSASCRLRVSVDMPAGLSDGPAGPAFRADATYMAGIAKAPLFDGRNADFVGRLRYVDLGFFGSGAVRGGGGIVTERALEPISGLRRARTDKRSYGHLFVFSGSANYPGAALMNVKAALRSGVGLVSAFVPERIAPAMAAAEPACIWVPCPETEDGSLSLEAFSLYKSMQGRESAILAGSGLGLSAETSALVCEIAKASEAPLVLDADAVRQNVLAAAGGGRVLATPHEGEFLRIAPGVSDVDLLEACSARGICCLLKGPISRASDGSEIARICAGGPQLSRAGSGDVLAGIAGGLAARTDLGLGLFECACAASLWAGRAAERAFACVGENAYSTSSIFEFLPEVFER